MRLTIGQVECMRNSEAHNSFGGLHKFPGTEAANYVSCCHWRNVTPAQAGYFQKMQRSL